MRTRTARVVAALLCAGTPTHGDPAAPTATVVTFEEAAAGQAPPGFTIALTGPGEAGTWLVEEEPGAPSGTKVLVQRSTDPTRARFPLCIHDAVSMADGTFSVRFKALSGAVDRAAGLVWRYQDADNYYLVRANALEGNVVLYKVERGKRADLKPIGGGFLAYGTKAGVDAGRWHTLAVDVRGDRFGVSLDGTHLFDVEDATFRGAGKVGLWTKADSVTAFDDLTIAPAATGGT